MTQNALSRELSFPELFRFALPSIVMMMFMSLYTVVDGLFVSRLVGSDALSAVNIAWPLISMINAIGIMFASGGSAIVARQMGEGQEVEANHSFSLIALANVLIGTGLAALCLLFLEPLMSFLGAEGVLRPLVADYLNLLLLFAPMSLFQMLFQNFFVTAGRPKLGLSLTILGGVANMVLDYVFIAVLDFGIRGAALATAMSYCIPAVGGLIFFSVLNRKGLHFTIPSRQLKLVTESCINGSSEMVSNLSGSVTTLLFNLVMLELAGSNGVAAITAVLLKYEYYEHEDGTGSEDKYNEAGFLVYSHIIDLYGEFEYYGDDEGNLLKYVDNGTVYEGTAIPSWAVEGFQLMQEFVQERNAQMQENMSMEMESGNMDIE